MTLVDLNDWIGRKEHHEDHLRAQPAQFMQATLDRPSTLKAGDALPPLWHWLYFLDAKPISELDRDAHPKRGGFLPPVDLPRRMWAGGRFSFQAPLLIGQDAQKTSTIKSIVEKVGRTGRLCFVTVEHQVSQNDVVCVTEEHDLVYREDPSRDATFPAPQQAPGGADFSRTITPSEVMLFRYSALTFNGHRIHYDADYARDVEGYDGLVFHGPLTASLLIDFAIERMGRNPTSFVFRGMAPIAGPRSFDIEGVKDGQTLHLWAKRAGGALAMTASAVF